MADDANVPLVARALGKLREEARARRLAARALAAAVPRAGTQIEIEMATVPEVHERRQHLRRVRHQISLELGVRRDALVRAFRLAAARAARAARAAHKEADDCRKKNRSSVFHGVLFLPSDADRHNTRRWSEHWVRPRRLTLLEQTPSRRQMTFDVASVLEGRLARRAPSTRQSTRETGHRREIVEKGRGAAPGLGRWEGEDPRLGQPQAGRRGAACNVAMAAGAVGVRQAVQVPGTIIVSASKRAESHLPRSTRASLHPRSEVL